MDISDSDYSVMPIQNLEDIAYRLQIDYKPPLVEDDRDRVIGEILKLRDTYNQIGEDSIMDKWKNRRVQDERICHENKTIINNDDVNLKSDAQLVFMADSLPNGENIHYCFDRVDDIEHLLNTSKNPLNSKTLNKDQIEYLQNNKNNGYPNISTGEFHTEAKSIFGPSDTVTYVEKPYIAKIKTLETFFENIGLIYTSNTLYEFASEFAVDNYCLFLKHKPINQKLPDGISRDTASSTTLSYIINYINIQIQLGNVNVVYDIAMIINEFYIMVRENLTYEELFKGHAKVYANSEIVELKWKPDFLVEVYLNNKILLRYGIDSNNLIHGRYQKFRDGNLLLEIHYKHGLREGKHILYGEDDQHNNIVIRKCKYVNDLMNGRVKIYYPNGQLKVQSNWVNGLRHGKSYLYDNQGSLIREALYENGVLIEGEEINDNVEETKIRYYPDGKISVMTPYINGYREGIASQYSTSYNNHMTMQLPYHNDEINGIQIKYSQNAQIIAEIPWVNGKKEGEKIVYNDDGTIEKKTPYHDGKKNGIEYRYNNNILIIETPWINGKIEGEELLYYTHPTPGKIRRKISYHNNQKNGIMVWYQRDGEIQKELHYVNNKMEGDVIEYYLYPNANTINKRSQYSNDRLHGVTSEYDLDGRIQKMTPWVNGKKEGEELEYYANTDKVKKRSLYHNDKLNGTVVEYDINGKVKVQTSYLDDVKHGDELEYHIGTNNVRKLSLYHNGKLHGVTSEYDINGIIQSQTYWVNGKPDHDVFELEYYPHPNSNSVKKRSSYKNGKLNGIQYEYYADTHIQKQTTWVNDIKEGEEIEYYPHPNEDKILSRCQYHNNMINGVKYEYYTDTHIKKQMTYIDGMKEGNEIEFHPSPHEGKIHIKSTYHNDMINGIQYEYYTEGNIRRRIQYINGVKDGYEVEFHPSPHEGTISSESEYHNNRIYNRKIFSPDGTVISAHTKYTYEGGKTLSKELKYYPDNDSPLVEFELNYVDGVLDGKQLNYNKSGRLKSKVKYSNGVMGIRTEYGYYEDQEHLRSKYKLLNSQYHGLQLLYFRDGQIESALEYSNGIKHGRYIEYYPDELGSTLHRVKTLYNYHNGQYDGQQLQYGLDGQILVDSEYSNGVQIKF